MSARRERKQGFATKLRKILGEFKNVLVVTVDNVGSNQMQKVRIALRGRAVLLMGKNTLIRKIIREEMVNNPKWENLLQFVYNNVGFVFTNDNLNEVRKTVVTNKVPAAARPGSFAPDDVHIPNGPTGLDPGQTSFFQALNIGTKIVKGTIEIINPVHLIKKGERVSSSHVALLTKLNILPFFFGFGVSNVYEDGNVYDAAVLDMSTDDLLAKFFNGVNKIAAVSLAIGYPTAASLKHNINGAFKKLVSICLATELTFAQAQQFKDYAANPGAFASAAPAAGAAKAAAAAPVKEKSEEEEADMGFSLFD